MALEAAFAYAGSGMTQIKKLPRKHPWRAGYDAAKKAYSLSAPLPSGRERMSRDINSRPAIL